MHFRTKLVLTLLVTLPSTLAIVNGDCTGRTGVCVSTSTCNKYGGTYYNNKCPNDPNDIKCCDNIPCSSGGQQGKCMKTSQCNGKTVAGLCPGNNDFKCCLSSTECTYQGLKGVCKNVSQCDGFNVSGLCPGGNEIRCCLPKNSCSSGGLSGQCIPVGQCSTNNIVSGLCPGGNEIKCCLPNSGNIVNPVSQCRNNGVTGGCQNPNSCNGWVVSNLCPGGSNNKCCIAKNKYNNKAEIAADYATAHALSGSAGKCGQYVATALRNAGFNIPDTGNHGYTFYSNNKLTNVGFREISKPSSYKKGDVYVNEKNANHPYGHVAIYNGNNWVSDFIQKSENVYKNNDGGKKHYFRY